MLKVISAITIICTIGFAIASALCWWRSSTVTVPHAHAEGSGMFYDGTIAIDGSDLFKTMRAQAKWSRLGAVFATLSVACQTVSLNIPTT